MTKFGMTLASLMVLVVLAIGAGIWYFTRPQPAVCTLEAMLCPDGTSVGRTGPNCTFAPCPLPPEGTKTMRDEATGVTYQYQDLTTQYISASEWPPQIALKSEAVVCTEAGTSTDPAEGTERRIIDGRDFCVTEVSEGAAGSTYTEYAYATAFDDGGIVLTFSLRYPQCQNYDEPQQTSCEAERSTFRPDDLIADLLPSLQRAP